MRTLRTRFPDVAASERVFAGGPSREDRTDATMNCSFKQTFKRKRVRQYEEEDNIPVPET